MFIFQQQIGVERLLSIIKLILKLAYAHSFFIYNSFFILFINWLLNKVY